MRPTSADDVAAAIRFGREGDLAIAVRCGGHSAPGYGTVDGGLLLDLRRMRGVTVDPERRRARVNGGALLAELDVAAQQHGLVCPVGVVSHTGVGGLTLGGGMGRLQRRFGLTIDSLRAAELVTADGRFVRACETEHPDLFWALRGAGPNFGVVTMFEFELHPFDGRVTHATATHPGHRVRDVWEIFRDFARTAPDHIHLAFGSGRAADESAPGIVAGDPVVTIGAHHSGDPADAARELEPLLSFGPPASRTFVARTQIETQQLFADELGWGHRVYTKGGFGDDLSPATLDALVAHMAADHAASFGLWTQGGAIARVQEDATAFTCRSAPFQMSVESSWDGRSLDAGRIAWARAAYAIVEPHSRAVGT